MSGATQSPFKKKTMQQQAAAKAWPNIGHVKASKITPAANAVNQNLKWHEMAI